MRFSFQAAGVLEAVKSHQQDLARAATATIREVAQLARRAGQDAIAAGGFSRKWQNALRADTFPKAGTSLHPAAIIRHKIPYAGVFQSGATIRGSPWLFLPLPDAPRVGGRPISPKRYSEVVGDLVMVRRVGKPPLLLGRIATVSRRTGGAGRFGRLKRRRFITEHRVPLYVGVPTVTITRKFDVIGAIKRVADRIPQIYSKHASHG